VFQWLARAIAAFFKSRALLLAENYCLRQRLLVHQRWHPRPALRDPDRRLRIPDSRWFLSWRGPRLVVKSETVVGWHRKGWKASCRWRSRAPANSGRRPIATSSDCSSANGLLARRSRGRWIVRAAKRSQCQSLEGRIRSIRWQLNPAHSDSAPYRDDGSRIPAGPLRQSNYRGEVAQTQFFLSC
jgi:hypothetical protein